MVDFLFIMVFSKLLFIAFTPHIRHCNVISLKGMFGDNVTSIYTEIDGRIKTLELTGEVFLVDVWKEKPSNDYSVWFKPDEVFWF